MKATTISKGVYYYNLKREIRLEKFKIILKKLEIMYKVTKGQKNTMSFVSFKDKDYGNVKYYYNEDRIYMSKGKKSFYSGLDWIMQNIIGKKP